MLSVFRSVCAFICGCLVICLASPLLVNAQDSYITGGCYCDYETRQTICTYEVFSGSPALSHMIFPMVPDCYDQFITTSDFFNFDTLQSYQDNFCGEIYGMKADQELEEGQWATFTITYDGLFPTGMGVVYAALKGGPNCEVFPVEGVIDCTPPPCIKWSLDASVFDFRIRKPGTYAACLALMTVESNWQINIGFDSFGDLIPVLPYGSGQIPAFYATAPAEQASPPEQFLTPADFDQQVLVVPIGAGEYRFSLWGKIEIGDEVTACEYGDEAIISLELENHEAYVDPGP